MDDALILVATFVACSVLCGAALALARAMYLRRRHLAERLGDARAALQLRRLPEDAVASAPVAAPVRPGWFTSLVRQSGLNIDATVGFLLALFVGVVLGAMALVALDSLAAAVAALVVGILLTIVFYVLRRRRRYRLIRDQLPEAIELLSRTARAGRSLDEGLTFVGNHAPRPLGSEFALAAGQLNWGLSLESAVRGMAVRVPLVEMQMLAATLIMQRRSGGNLPSILDRLSLVIRERLSHVRRFQAATATARISLYLIILLSVGALAFMFVWMPDYFPRFLETWFGIALLCASIVLYIVGLVWLLWLLRIQE